MSQHAMWTGRLVRVRVERVRVCSERRFARDSDATETASRGARGDPVEPWSVVAETLT